MTAIAPITAFEVAPPSEKLQIKLRVSSFNQDCSNSDIKMVVDLNETVSSVKRRLGELHNIDPHDQRLFFSGKLMRDKERLKAHKLKKNVVIQVVVREKEKSLVTVESPSQRGHQ